MGQDVFDVQPLAGEVGPHDQAVLVAADVEDDESGDPVGAAEVGLHLREGGVVGRADVFVLGAQGQLGIGMFCPKIQQGTEGQHVHAHENDITGNNNYNVRL